MTLVELLIVLAIVAMMAAVAIPTFSRLGFLSGNQVQNCAREMYAVLRATKIYAATYRVNTALAYQISPFQDSLTGGTTDAVNAIAMVYTIEEWDYYVPVPSAESTRFGAAVFKTLVKDTAVLMSSFESGSDTPIQIKNGGDFVGLDEDASGLIERDEAEIFSAHVFLPSGRIAAGNAPERFEVHVGFAPDQSPEERFNDATHTERTITIELYRATGRVKIARD